MDISKSVQTGIESAQALTDQRRKTMAYNALQKVYGDIAGDPAAALQMQTYGFNDQANPLKLQGMDLENQGAKQTLDYNALANPLKLEGLQLGNTSQDLTNQKTGFDVAHQGEAFTNDQAQKKAQTAAEYAAAASSNASTAKTQQETAFSASDRAALAGSYMVGAMIDARKKGATPEQLTQLYDKYAPQIGKIDAVDPQHLAMVRQAIATDPDRALPFLQQQLSGAGSTLDPQTAALLGTTFLRTGMMPSLGQGKAGTANRILVAKTAAQQAASEGKTGDDVVDERQTYKSRQAYLTDLAKSSPTSAGGLTRSAGAVLAHMDTLDQYIGALQNGDVRAANSLNQEFKKQTGKAAPTNFDAQKIIVTDELTRYLIARGGTGGDRAEMKDQISKASSPTQLRNVINTWKDDMVGQLAAQRQQADAFKATDQFDKQLTPRARELLSSHGSGSSGGADGWKIEVVQ